MTDDPNACASNQAEHEARFQRVMASPFFGQRLGARGPLRDYEDREGVDEVVDSRGHARWLFVAIALIGLGYALAFWALHSEGWI